MKKIATWSLRVLLSLVFLIVGCSKLTASLHTVEFFDAVGWGQWLRYLTGMLDVVAAIFLFIPRWCFFGALILMSNMGLATGLCMLKLHQSFAVPLVLMLLAGSVAWLTRPGKREDRQNG